MRKAPSRVNMGVYEPYPIMQQSTKKFYFLKAEATIKCVQIWKDMLTVMHLMVSMRKINQLSNSGKKIKKVKKVAVQKCPRWTEHNKLGLHQNCIFQNIWVNALWLIQLVSEQSTMRTNRYMIMKPAPEVSQVHAGLKYLFVSSNTSWVPHVFAV